MFVLPIIIFTWFSKQFRRSAAPLTFQDMQPFKTCNWIMTLKTVLLWHVTSALLNLSFGVARKVNGQARWCPVLDLHNVRLSILIWLHSNYPSSSEFDRFSHYTSPKSMVMIVVIYRMNLKLDPGTLTGGCANCESLQFKNSLTNTYKIAPNVWCIYNKITFFTILNM